MKRLKVFIDGNPATLKGGADDGPKLSKAVGNLQNPLESTTSGLNMSDGVFQKTVFASTNENKETFGLAGVVTSQTAQTQGELTASVLINGITTFSGKCNVQGADEDGNIVTEMVSEGNALWEALSKKSLRELDLGIEHHDISSIKASFSNAYSDGDKGIFAPVWYGKLTPGVGGLGDYSWRAQDFRYHVFFPTIVYAIFKEAGFSLQSDFFATEYFRRWVYLFGVGDLLVKPNIVDFCTASAKNTISQVIGISTQKVNMANEISDPCGQWNPTTSTFTASSAGDYVFNFFLRGSSTITSVIINGAPFSPVSPGIFDVTYSVALSSGQTVIFEAVGTASGDTVFNANFSASGGTTASDTAFDFSVASCLHDEPCKNFLSGITHLFNLVWFVNPVTRVVYCEPMFDYHLKGRIDTDGPEYDTKMNGWYKNISTESEPFITVKCPPGAYQIDFISPFGGVCNMGFKENSDDPVFVYHEKYDASEIEPFTVRLSFPPRGNESKDFRNPYFSALLNVDAPGVTWGLPSALPNGKDLVVATGDKTFEHEPQCGIVYRNFTYIYVDNDALSSPSPLIVGGRDNEFFTNAAPDGWDYFIGCYADIVTTISGILMPGLFSMFYKQWYAILRHGQIITLQGKTNPVDFAGDDFKMIRLVDTGHDQFLALLAEINDFDVIGNESAEMVLVKWRSGPDSSDMDAMSQNSEIIYPPRVF